MTGPGTNTGHGHVWERPDGSKARCGGPKMCEECAKDAATHGTPERQPIELRVSRELLEQMLCLGKRRIVGVRFEPLPNATTEPTAQVVFDIEAHDAPPGTKNMNPTLQQDYNTGTVHMTDPGWQS